MGLEAINSQYLGLNGLAGYGCNYAGGIYGGGLYGASNVGAIEQNIQNGYEVGACSSAYSNKANVSSANFAQQCQSIQYLLNSGSTDDAILQYDSLYRQMKENPYYQNYSTSEIKTLLQQKYMEATGTTIVNDIDTKVSGSFVTGLKNTVPVVGLMCQDVSKEDFISKATGTPKSDGATVKEILGVAAGTAASGGIGYAVSKGLRGGKGWKGAVIGAVASVGTYLLGKLFNNMKADNA